MNRVPSAMLDNGNIQINVVILSFQGSVVEAWEKNMTSSQCVPVSVAWKSKCRSSKGTKEGVFNSNLDGNSNQEGTCNDGNA